MDEIRETPIEYTPPKIVDHGDLQELTAKGGGAFADMPIGPGDPVGPDNTFSQP